MAGGEDVYRRPKANRPKPDQQNDGGRAQDSPQNQTKNNQKKKEINSNKKKE